MALYEYLTRSHLKHSCLQCLLLVNIGRTFEWILRILIEKKLSTLLQPKKNNCVSGYIHKKNQGSQVGNHSFFLCKCFGFVLLFQTGGSACSKTSSQATPVTSRYWVHNRIGPCIITAFQLAKSAYQAKVHKLRLCECRDFINHSITHCVLTSVDPLCSMSVAYSSRS